MLVSALHLSSFSLFSAMGGWVLYTDFRFQKIRNKVLLWGLLFAAGAYGLAFLATLLATVGVPILGTSYYTWSFYEALLLHAALSGAAALALWNLKIWPAGDAKLFALFSVLMPLVETGLPGFPNWLFMTCLINVFLPPAFFIVARAIWWGLRRSSAVFNAPWRAAARAKVADTLASWRADPSVPLALGKKIVLHQIFYMSYYLVIYWFRDSLPASGAWISPILGVALMFGVGRLQKFLNRGLEVILPVFLTGATWMYFHYGAAAALVAVGRGLQFSLTVGLAAELAYAYLSRLETREVSVDDLQPYQVLAQKTLDEFRRDIVFLGENFNLAYRDGILPGQIDGVRDWLRKRGIDKAVIYNTTPFAPWIVFGFCLTLLLRADIAWLMTPHLDLSAPPAATASAR